MSKNSKILAAFAISCTLVVGLVNELTKEKIKAQEQLQLQKTLHSIISPERYNNDITNDCIEMTSTYLGTSDTQKGYIARLNNNVQAVAITAIAPDGYNGNIELIIAVNMDESVSGVRVLKHQETPGLGDKIELRKSDWITTFSDKKLLSQTDSRWAVAKENGMFDQFTGATITPRAVIKAVKNAVHYFNSNKANLLTQPNVCNSEALDLIEDEIKPKQSTPTQEKEND
ncbi:electron transport complex subunit RsxG [Colwellia sp. RSH04]|uniref:electron transport complex subunit RsxG n=1 Tax=Colwellia sp. RSH04 TaxID=2305464 RepID=UPI000E584351|nr:electron transport complex subunit RsxG [Colwellia sp. RSH04]RHW74997.1 electron transport complex subunit RsxG [Colwellia sp. RSH04]